jgi:hypothetical protein
VVETSDDLDLPEEAVGSDYGCKLRMKDLDGHFAGVSRVPCRKHSRHAPPAELVLDRVTIVQGLTQT